MNKYVFIKTVLQQGEYTFQVKADEEGLILDIFEHFEEMGIELIDRKSICYDEIGLKPMFESDQKVKIAKWRMTLREKAVEMSDRRTEIAGKVNTEWTPITKNEEIDYEEEHLGCYSYPNCDLGVGGCSVAMGDDVEEYGHRD